jgi:hypothetical protein
MNFTAMALFCEDIRDEAGGTNTLVGVLPDNIRIGAPPPEVGVAALAKLGFYSRVHVPIDTPGVEPLEIILTNGGDEQVLSTMSVEFIENALNQARGNGSPHAGLITRVVVAPFAVLETKTVSLVARTPTKRVLAASMNIDLAQPSPVEVASSPTASPPPASKSQRRVRRKPT